MKYHFKEVVNGQYTVEIDLKTCLSSVSYTHLTLPTTPYV